MAGEKLTCICCNKTLAKEAFFNNRNKFIGEQYSICKSCVSKLVNENDLLSVLKFFRLIDVPFIDSRWQGVMNKGGNGVIGNYLKQMSLLKDKYFDDGDLFSLNEKSNQLLETKSKNENTEFKNIELTEDDLKAQEDVIRLLGYDPYIGYTDEDKKYLYGNLLIYLNEDTLEDGIKLSAYLQIVNNNNQIRKIDLAISSLNSDIKSMVDNAKEINTLQDVKSKIVTSNDKIMKENSISVKNRGDKKAGRSTLTYMMRDLRELEFEDAEEDYYDQRKAYGMKLVSDISNKSLLEQLSFDENDYVDIIKAQREKLQQLEDKNNDIEEENRQLYVEIDLLKKLNK